MFTNGLSEAKCWYCIDRYVILRFTIYCSYIYRKALFRDCLKKIKFVLKSWKKVKKLVCSKKLGCSKKLIGVPNNTNSFHSLRKRCASPRFLSEGICTLVKMPSRKVEFGASHRNTMEELSTLPHKPPASHTYLLGSLHYVRTNACSASFFHNSVNL